MAGLLAAAVLAEEVDVVTVLDRDHFADDPAPRKGIPQARHVHLLLARGARAMESLLPGISRDLTEAGAHHIDVPGELLMYTPSGWVPRLGAMQFFLSGSRGLIDWRVRRRVLENPRIKLVEGVDILGLTGDASKVTGARVRYRGTKEPSTVKADLIVDATGRGSRAPDWLTELGFPQVRELVVDGGIAYATRVYRLRDESGQCPAVYIQPNTEGTGQGGALLPVEDGNWVLSLSGMRGGEPPTDEQEFEEFARRLPHTLIADLMAGLEPVGPVHGFRNIANRQRYYERLSLPGFIVVGDAACTFNPVYGHGMSVAALGAQALRDKLRKYGLVPGLSKKVQRAIAWAAFDPWNVVTGQDRRYPKTIGPPRNVFDRLITRYVDRVGRTSIVRPNVTRAIVDANTMSVPLASLVAPKIVIAAIRGPGRGWAIDEDPPLTKPERQFLEGLPSSAF
jgi:2-polyprenyl-6-methoxyphenol hydroxylase-like FAD-dependent oxidoreductase